eukprot:TRINITY_DN8860_c1_g2_i2.p1 TRINITY_DN8860_c1_g2~~TRINITY_DN8860_c1_g2_i2.p1  ORF type:complete len:279 (+),score=27.15 TRINITY_DN8860_c1_g2_i2:258-1094(+)
MEIIWYQKNLLHCLYNQLESVILKATWFYLLFILNQTKKFTTSRFKQNIRMQASRLENAVQFKSELMQGQAKFGPIICSGCLSVAEQFASRYDFALVDLQHSAMTRSDVSAMLAAIRPMGTTFVRVRTPDDEPFLQLALDSGADGVVFPTIKSVQEAKRAIELCLYPPQGHRSSFPYIREALTDDFLTHLQNANTGVIKMAMIETQECLENLDAILGLKPGFDVALLGPFDLSVALSLHEKYNNMSEIMGSIELKSAMEMVIKACEKYGVIPGTVRPC